MENATVQPVVLMIYSVVDKSILKQDHINSGTVTHVELGAELV
jgi:hypothetical protein